MKMNQNFADLHKQRAFEAGGVEAEKPDAQEEERQPAVLRNCPPAARNRGAGSTATQATTSSNPGMPIAEGEVQIGIVRVRGFGCPGPELAEAVTPPAGVPQKAE